MGGVDGAISIMSLASIMSFALHGIRRIELGNLHGANQISKEKYDVLII